MKGAQSTAIIISLNPESTYRRKSRSRRAPLVGPLSRDQFSEYPDAYPLRPTVNHHFISESIQKLAGVPDHHAWKNEVVYLTVGRQDQFKYLL
jgi:hypothetical protein